ncbi:MAG: hypothetical protein V1870_05700 [Candidatus Aenigmatarchaeota archaeon]
MGRNYKTDHLGAMCKLDPVSGTRELYRANLERDGDAGGALFHTVMDTGAKYLFVAAGSAITFVIVYNSTEAIKNMF